jgi:hypothetical protein
MAQHAKLSASGSERWINCPASISACKGIESTSSIYADEGTKAHELAEKCLRENTNCNDEFVQNYIDYVRSFDGELLVEQRVDFSRYVPEGFGTADSLVIDAPNKHLHVIDLKFGRGVAVYAENNTQGQLYALGACLMLKDRYRFDNITIHIHQPRINNISTWTITNAQLKEFALFVRERAKIALSDNAPFNPTEKACMWCAAKPTCTALAQKNYALITSDFDDIAITPTPPQVDSLTPKQISDLLPHLPLLEQWIKSVKDHAFHLAESNQLDGYKLVAGRSSRKWIDEPSAIDALKTIGIEPFKSELLSVAQAEKLISKEQKQVFNALYTSIYGAATIVPITDKRPALNNLLDSFEIV